MNRPPVLLLPDPTHLAVRFLKTKTFNIKLVAPHTSTIAKSGIKPKFSRIGANTKTITAESAVDMVV
jgi:hypothetical protein